MQKIYRFSLLILCQLLLVPPLLAQSMPDDSHALVLDRLQALEDDLAIRQRLQEYMEVLTAADWDAYVDYFVEDASIIMTEGTVTGRDAIKQRMSSASTRMSKAAEGQPFRKRKDLLTNILVKVDGDKAKVESRFTFISQNSSGGFEVYGSGMYYDEWIRKAGRWFIYSRTVDYDMLRGVSGQ